MKRFFFLFSFLLSTIYYLLSTPSTALAVDPFPPFSIEGNPDYEYQFEYIFPLFTYIKPASFQVFENRDYSRQYDKLGICPGGDYRDYECAFIDGSEIDNCDGGDVDICKVSEGHVTNERAYTDHSNPTQCKGKQASLRDDPGIETPGTCEYTQVPKIFSEIRGTDFSKENREDPQATSTEDTTQTDPVITDGNTVSPGLIFPKLQTESGYYGNYGTDNSLTWGSQFLTLSDCDRIIRQLLVVYRAGETKKTLAETGEWPLGWVDWGYQTRNGKTLLQIREEIPGEMAGSGRAIAESLDDFYLNSGNIDIVSDTTEIQNFVCKFATENAAKNPVPEWLEDLRQAPIYPPSFRQGFVRGSICIWNLCCPGLVCPLDRDAGELEGKSKSLYYDISISQAFNAALDDLLLTYPLGQASEIYRKIVSANHLVRFAGSASTQAIPSVIRERLNDEISDPCFKYRPNPFLWSLFGYRYDYLETPSFLDPDKKCPGYVLQPNLTKEKAGAFPESILQQIVNLIWKGASGRGTQDKVDEVEPVKYHLLTVPDAMGQSISVIQRQVYNTRDTLEELQNLEEYNKSIGNIVDDQADFLHAGKSGPVADAKRRLAYFTCNDAYFSAQQETGIEAYALGTRIGCDDSDREAGVCDGSLFTQMYGDSEPLPPQAAIDVVMNSKLFVNGALNPDLAKVYAATEKSTKVPCEVLAGHHFEEASSTFTDGGDPTKKSVANGGDLRGYTLQETADIAAKALKRHPIGSTQQLITAISYFNGGGNANCQAGYPYNIPYSGCPKQFNGEDDPYAVNMLDARHNDMYLLYHDDFLPGEPTPYGQDRPGAYTVALIVHDAIKNGAVAPTQSPEPTKDPTPTKDPFSTRVEPNGSCGDGYIDTALGCIPYGREFAGALIGFIGGISGAISLVVMLFSTISLMTAGGDPEKIKKAKELFTGAVTGLLFVVFSVTLLRIIAGDIIKLPGF